MFTIRYSMSYGKGDSSETWELDIDEELYDKIKSAAEPVIARGEIPDEECPELEDIISEIQELCKDECSNILSETGDSYAEEYENEEESVFENGYKANVEYSPYILNEDEAEIYFDAIFSNEDLTDDECQDKYYDVISEVDEEDYLPLAFMAAVKSGREQFVSEHVDDMDLAGEDDYGLSYLAEAATAEIEQLLLDSGAMWDDEHYEGYPFAMSSYENQIISYTESFRKDVLRAYCENFDVSEKKIAKWLDDIDEIDEDFERVDEFEEDMEAIGVYSDGKELEFSDRTYEDGDYLKDLLEELGFDVCFMGDEWKLNTVGVWYVE